MSDRPLVVTYKDFRGTLTTWDELFTQAANFATRIGGDRLISISHSADRSEGVVTVWYWTEPGIVGDDDEAPGPPRGTP